MKSHLSMPIDTGNMVSSAEHGVCRQWAFEKLVGSYHTVALVAGKNGGQRL